MARPSKYPTELRERAVRMVIECRQDYPHESAAIRSVASKLGITSIRLHLTNEERGQVAMALAK